MSEYGVNTWKVVLAGLLGAILTVAAVMALQALYYRHLSGVQDTEEFSEPSPKLQELLRDQRTQLAEYRPIDAEKGIVAVPIERAMELVVAELSQPEAGGPVEDAALAEENHDEP